MRGDDRRFPPPPGRATRARGVHVADLVSPRRERGEPEGRTVFYFSLLGTLGSAVWMLFAETHPVGGAGALLLLGVGVFGTLAQLAMTRAYKRGKTLVAASLAYSAVIFASLFGMLIWQETLSLSAWLAIGLIVASGVMANAFAPDRRTGSE